jgi:hypothetical protein
MILKMTKSFININLEKIKVNKIFKKLLCKKCFDNYLKNKKLENLCNRCIKNTQNYKNEYIKKTLEHIKP